MERQHGKRPKRHELPRWPGNYAGQRKMATCDRVGINPPGVLKPEMIKMMMNENMIHVAELCSNKLS